MPTSNSSNHFFKQFRVSPCIHDPSQDKDLPGDELFKKCLHGYMDRWHGKHPSPWDFFYSFNNIAGKNLDWFWSNWFFSNHYIDLAIVNAKPAKNGYEIVIKNIGGMPAPVDIVVKYADGTGETIHQTPPYGLPTHNRRRCLSIPKRKSGRFNWTVGYLWTRMKAIIMLP